MSKEIALVASAFAGGVALVMFLKSLFSPDKKELRDFYHYTDKQGAEGIKREKKIWPSTDPRDMMIGKGVYLTTKCPNKHSKNDILQNNYDSASQSKNRDRVKYVVKITLPTSHVEKAKKSSRDVYKYKGESALDLNNYHYEIIKW